MIESAIRTAAYNAIAGAVSQTVYANGASVPDNLEAAYVVIGALTAIPFDSDGATGFECTLTVHAWDTRSNSRSFATVYDISGQCYNALHRQERTVTVSGYHVVGIDRETSEDFIDADGLSRRVLQRYRILVRQP
jgi:hypothetical protein